MGLDVVWSPLARQRETIWNTHHTVKYKAWQWYDVINSPLQETDQSGCIFKSFNFVHPLRPIQNFVTISVLGFVHRCLELENFYLDFLSVYRHMDMYVRLVYLRTSYVMRTSYVLRTSYVYCLVHGVYWNIFWSRAFKLTKRNKTIMPWNISNTCFYFINRPFFFGKEEVLLIRLSEDSSYCKRGLGSTLVTIY